MSNPILVVGDTHGNSNYWAWFFNKAQLPQRWGVKTIISVGDWGYWPRLRDGGLYIELLETKLAELDIEFLFIDGNHEDHETLNSVPLDETNFLFDPTRPYLRRITQHISHIPRGTMIQREGKNILCVGGTFSIDRDNCTQGYDWFPEELMTYGDIDKALRYTGQPAGQPDVVITHDCPSIVPITDILPNGHVKHREARSQRELLNNVWEAYRPELWLHGHYHRRYSGLYEGTQFEGLGHGAYRDTRSWYALV